MKGSGSWARVGFLALMIAVPTAAAARAKAPRELTLDIATKLARKALDVCQSQGNFGSSSVVDVHGIPLVVLRTTQSPKPPVAAVLKASTAVAFDQSGVDMTRRAEMDAAFANEIASSPDKYNNHPGSVPLHIAGKLVGGLAVADVSHDAAAVCAAAAAKAFQFQ